MNKLYFIIIIVTVYHVYSDTNKVLYKFLAIETTILLYLYATIRAHEKKQYRLFMYGVCDCA